MRTRLTIAGDLIPIPEPPPEPLVERIAKARALVKRAQAIQQQGKADPLAGVAADLKRIERLLKE